VRRWYEGGRPEERQKGGALAGQTASLAIALATMQGPADNRMAGMDLRTTAPRQGNL
jgi:hypothetical protein